MTNFKHGCDVKKYLFDFLNSENIKNIDVFENLDEFKVINYNINFTEDKRKSDFKYINYIPIQLYNENTNEILTVLQQSVAKNTFKIRKSQTLLEFDANVDEFLTLYKGPERDAIMKFKTFETSESNFIKSRGNYNIPNSMSLYLYLTDLECNGLVNEKINEINTKSILEIDNVNEIMLKNLVSKVVFNKNYRNKLLRQIEYYYYYKDYETAKKLATNVSIVFSWFMNSDLSLESKLQELNIEENVEDDLVETTENQNINIKKGLTKELATIQKVIGKCDQKLII
ncbi:hypothetical protein QEN19_002682 [Hanseniaspora menglaensis]